MYLRLSTVTGAVAASLLLAGAAHAATVTLEAGTGSAGSVSVSGSSTSGSLSANLSGVQVNATGINLPQLLNSTLTTSNLPPETLNIWITETGLTAPLGSAGFLSSFGLDPAGTKSNVTVLEQTFLSAADTAFGTDTLLSSSSCTLSGCVPLTGSATGATGSGPYSVTEEYSITLPTWGNAVSASIGLDPPPPATPIPGTLPLFASGIAGLWAWSRKRKPKASLSVVPTV